jgi:hypothetical protein
MNLEAGPVLDRLIELRVFGRKPVADVPPYSTTDPAADVVVRTLATAPRRWMCVQTGKDWTFHWRKPMTETDLDSTATRYVNLITVTAPTRPLAICLAALKLVGPIGGERPMGTDLPGSGGRAPSSPENAG